MKSVREIESDLSHLMKEFEAGRMQAFGDPDMISRMDNIRQMQEKLAQKHFCFDDMDTNPEEKEKMDITHDRKKTQELMQDLDALTTELQQLKPVPILESMLSSSSSSLLGKLRVPPKNCHTSVHSIVDSCSGKNSPMTSHHTSNENLPLLTTSNITFPHLNLKDPVTACLSVPSQHLTNINIEVLSNSLSENSLSTAKVDIATNKNFKPEKQPLL